MDDLLDDFVAEAAETLDAVDADLVRLESDPQDGAALANVFRHIHTVKGTCGFIGLPRLETVAHAAETVLGRLRDGGLTVTPGTITPVLAAIDRIKMIVDHLSRDKEEPPGDDAVLVAQLEALSAGGGAESAVTDRFGEAGPEVSDVLDLAGGLAGTSTIRVRVDVLESLMEMISELVLSRNQLNDLLRLSGEPAVKASLQRLSSVAAELQSVALKARMQPISMAWSKLPRMVRDLSRDLDKPIRLAMTGGDTELDRQVLDVVRDPLTHLVRNAADHGLETQDARRTAGKPQTGQIALHAEHRGGHMVVTVSDDGRGLDLAAIRKRAVSTGLADAAGVDDLTDAQVTRFLFMPGFSTAAAVTTVSGRGVGLDVVRANIEAIGGDIDVHSEPGKGTVFTLKLPLTLTIVPALIVRVGGERFAVPQISVTELVRTAPDTPVRLERVGDTALLYLRNRLVPLIGLADCLADRDGAADRPTPISDEALVIVHKVGNDLFGLVVDDVIDSEDIVLKPLAPLLRGQPVCSGQTILGDGTVIVIVDPAAIAHALRSEDRLTDPMSWAGAALPENRDPDRQAVPMVLVEAGGGAPKAMPLNDIRRIEAFSPADIEMIHGLMAVHYRGSIVPLIGLSSGPGPGQPAMLTALMLEDGEAVFGLAVDRVLDTVEVDLPDSTATEPGGSIVIGEQICELIDCDAVHTAGRAAVDRLAVRRRGVAA